MPVFSLFLEVGRGKTFQPGESTKLDCFQMKLQLQAAQPREARNGHTIHLASFFQFIFVHPQEVPSLSHYTLEEFFEERQQRTR